MPARTCSKHAEQTISIRKVILACALLAAFPNNPAVAASLGELHVQSALGEPLRATIRIGSPSSVGADCVRVTTQGNDDGLPRIRDARIDLTTVNGTRVLALKGSSPINDPIVKIGVEVTCEGRFIRDYTALLSPPEDLIAIQSAAPSTAPAARAQRPAPRATPTPAAPSPAARSPVSAQPPAAIIKAPPVAAQAVDMAVSNVEGTEFYPMPGMTLQQLVRLVYPNDRPARVALVERIVSANPEHFRDGWNATFAERTTLKAPAQARRKELASISEAIPAPTPIEPARQPASEQESVQSIAQTEIKPPEPKVEAAAKEVPASAASAGDILTLSGGASDKTDLPPVASSDPARELRAQQAWDDLHSRLLVLENTERELLSQVRHLTEKKAEILEQYREETKKTADERERFQQEMLKMSAKLSAIESQQPATQAASSTATLIAAIIFSLGFGLWSFVMGRKRQRTLDQRAAKQKAAAETEDHNPLHQI